MSTFWPNRRTWVARANLTTIRCPRHSCPGMATTEAAYSFDILLAARRFTCWTRSAVRSYGKCATPRPATKRTPFTALRARLPQSLIAAPTRAERGAAAILVLARERRVEAEAASNQLVARCCLDVLYLWITKVL